MIFIAVFRLWHCQSRQSHRASVVSLAKEKVQLSIIMLQLQSTQCGHADKPVFQIVSLSDRNLQQPKAYS